MRGVVVLAAMLVVSCGSETPASPPPPSSAPASVAPAPTTTVPIAPPIAAVEPFVADVWLLRTNPEDDDDPGRRVVVLSTADTEGQRPDGLPIVGSAVAHEGSFTFYQLHDPEPSPVASVALLGDGTTCEARVTRATRVRIGSDTMDEEELADIEAWMFDFDGCPDGALAAGPGPAVTRTYAIDDSSTFGDPPADVVAAVGTSLAGPIRSHALPSAGTYVVGNADRFCLVRDGEAECDSRDVPFAEVRVGGRTFVLMHGENDDYAVTLDAPPA